MSHHPFHDVLFWFVVCFGTLGTVWVEEKVRSGVARARAVIAQVEQWIAERDAA